MQIEKHPVLLSRRQIDRRIAELGAAISSDYAGQSLTVVGILKSCFIFVADLVRRIDASIPVEVDFISVSSYGDAATSSGQIRIRQDIATPLSGKAVLLVEDIVDTGLTLAYVRRLVESRGTSSVRVAALLEKPDHGQYDGSLDYVGFKIPNRFVVGYGLDYAEGYRHLPDIHVLDRTPSISA